MLLSEVLPLLKELSHIDKLLLLDFLASELLTDACLTRLETQSKLSSPTLYDSFGAAAVLAKALADEQAAKHG